MHFFIANVENTTQLYSLAPSPLTRHGRRIPENGWKNVAFLRYWRYLGTLYSSPKTEKFFNEIIYFVSIRKGPFVVWVNFSRPRQRNWSAFRNTFERVSVHFWHCWTQQTEWRILKVRFLHYGNGSLNFVCYCAEPQYTQAIYFLFQTYRFSSEEYCQYLGDGCDFVWKGKAESTESEHNLLTVCRVWRRHLCLNQVHKWQREQ